MEEKKGVHNFRLQILKWRLALKGINVDEIDLNNIPKYGKGRKLLLEYKRLLDKKI